MDDVTKFATFLNILKLEYIQSIFIFQLYTYLNKKNLIHLDNCFQLSIFRILISTFSLKVFLNDKIIIEAFATFQHLILSETTNIYKKCFL